MANYINLPRVAAGESVTVSFDISEDVSGWALAARYGPDRAGVPWVVKTTDATGTDQVTVGAGTAGTGAWVLTAADTGRTLGPGVWPVSLWRTDAGLEARLAWGEQVILPSIADAVV